MISLLARVLAFALAVVGGMSSSSLAFNTNVEKPVSGEGSFRADVEQVPAAFAFPSGGRTGSTPTFFQVKLAHGVVIDLPRSWRILGRDELQLIETSAGAVLDLSDADIEEGATVVLVAANSTPASTYASVRVTSYSPPSATLAEIEALSAMVGASSKTNNDLKEFEQALLPTLEKGLGIQKIPLLEFFGVRMERVGGYPAFVSEYRRSGPKGDVYVQLNQIFTPQGDVEVTLAYRGIEKALWMPVLARVRSSLTFERTR